MANEVISIIIPVYKAEKYLDRCLNSVLNQTFRDLEVILIELTGMVASRRYDAETGFSLLQCGPAE